jgi:hypothetical protein
MEEAILKAPTDTAAAAKVSAAFGANWQSRHDELKKTIAKMKDAKMTVSDTNPKTYDDAKGGKAQRASYDHKTGRTNFGSVWQNRDSELHRAGVMVHELSHQVAKTGDHVDTSNKKFKFLNSKEADKEEKAGSKNVVRKGACKSCFPERHFRSVPRFAHPILSLTDIDTKTDDLVAYGPEQRWQNMVDNSPNGDHVADAWKVLFSECVGKLKRRALDEDDPVRVTQLTFTSKTFFAIF